MIFKFMAFNQKKLEQSKARKMKLKSWFNITKHLLVYPKSTKNIQMKNSAQKDAHIVGSMTEFATLLAK